MLNMTRIYSSPLKSTLASQGGSAENAALEIDAVQNTFSREACRFESLVAMASGSLCFRLSRMAFLESFSTSALMRHSLAKPALQAFSWTAATASEVTMFRSVNEFLSDETASRPQTWLCTFIDFFAMKAFSPLGNGHLFLSHLAQDGAMVAGHQAGHALGITEAPEGSLAQQFFRAEAMTLQMGAGAALAARMSGHRLHFVERSAESRCQLTVSRSSIAQSSPLALQMHTETSLGDVITRSSRLPADAAELMDYMQVRDNSVALKHVTSRPESASHLRRSKEAILEAAALVPQRTSATGEESERLVAVVLGAGSCSDIPVVELVRKFRFRVTLVDLNEFSLRDSIRSLPDDVRPYVKGVVADLSYGTIFEVARAVRQLEAASKSSYLERLRILSGLVQIIVTLKGRTFEANWLDLVGEARADLLVSSMVADQAYTPLGSKLVGNINDLINGFLEFARSPGPKPAYLFSDSFLKSFDLMSFTLQYINHYQSAAAQQQHAREVESMVAQGSVAYVSIDTFDYELDPETFDPVSKPMLFRGPNQGCSLQDTLNLRRMKVHSREDWIWDFMSSTDLPGLLPVFGPVPRSVHWKKIESMILFPEAFETSGKVADATPLREDITVLVARMRAQLRSGSDYAREAANLLTGLESEDLRVALRYAELMRHLSGEQMAQRIPRDCLIALAACLQRHPHAEVIEAIKLLRQQYTRALDPKLLALVAAHLYIARFGADESLRSTIEEVFRSLRANPQLVDEHLARLSTGTR